MEDFGNVSSTILNAGLIINFLAFIVSLIGGGSGFIMLKIAKSPSTTETLNETEINILKSRAKLKIFFYCPMLIISTLTLIMYYVYFHVM